jgi:hypothetical protein
MSLAALVERRLISDVRGGVQHELAHAGNADFHHRQNHRVNRVRVECLIAKSAKLSCT